MTKYVSKESTHKKLTVAAKDSWFSKDLQLLGIVPFIPNWILLALYGYLGFRFFSGFDQTTYNKVFYRGFILFFHLLKLYRIVDYC